MKNLTTPISFSRACLMGGNNRIQVNSEKKALSYLRFITDVFDKDSDVTNDEIDSDANLEDVMDIFSYDEYCTRLQVITQTSQVEIIPKESGRKAYAEAIIVSSEDSFTTYVFHVSFLTPMKLISMDFYNLFISCIALLRRVGIIAFSHSRWGDEVEDYAMEEDNVDVRVEHDERNGSIEQDEIEAEYREMIERDKRRMNKEVMDDIENKIFDKKEFLEMIEKIPLDIQPNVILKEFAVSMINLVDSRTIDSFFEASIKDFFKRNHDTEDAEFINEYFPVTYEDLFYVSWANQNLVGDWLSESLSVYGGEYGQAEYFKKFIIKNKKDLSDLYIKSPGEYAVLRDLTSIFLSGWNLAAYVEDYLKEKYNGKKEKH